MLFFYSDMPVAPDLHYNTTLNSTGMVAIVMADNLCPVMPMHYNGRKKYQTFKKTRTEIIHIYLYIFTICIKFRLELCLKRYLLD